MTGYVRPMLASPLDEGLTVDRFNPAEWWLEEKFDGERVTVVVHDDQTVSMWSRPGPGKTVGLSRIAPANVRTTFAQFPPGTYDGELVVDGGHSSDVKRLTSKNHLVFVLFDVVAIDGQNLMGRVAWDRRQILDKLAAGLRECGVTCVRVADVLTLSHASVQAIWDRGGEGAMLKRRRGFYRPGARSKDWLKVKKFVRLEATPDDFSRRRGRRDHHRDQSAVRQCRSGQEGPKDS